MNTPKRLGVMVAAVFALVGSAYAVDFNADCYQTSQHEIFTSALQRFVRATNNKNVVRKTTAKPTAGLVGYRYSTSQWSAGLAVSYESGLSTNYGDAENFRQRDETIGFSLFGKYNGFSGWYLQSSFFTGFNRKKVIDGYDEGNISRDGKASSTYFAASLELGKDFEFGEGTRVTPHLGLTYAYAPSKDLPFRFDGVQAYYDTERQNFFEVPLGVTFAKDFHANDWRFTPSLDLTMVTSLGNMKDGSYNYRTGFAAYDGSKWQVYGVGAGHFGGRVTAGLNAVKSERLDIGVSYAYEGRKKYQDHRLTAGIGLKF